MSNKNNSIINNLLDKVDIVNIISQYVKLQRKGSNYVGLCPFHADHNPSMSVSNTKKIFKCFVCQEGGNVIQFVQKFQKIPWIEAVREVAQKSGIDSSELNQWFSKNKIDPAKEAIYKLNDQVNKWFQIFLKDKNHPIAYDYLKKRHLTDDLINKYEFGYAGNQANSLYQLIKENFINSKILTQDQVLNSGLVHTNDQGQFVDFLYDRLTLPIRDANGYIVGFGSRSLSDNGPKYLNTISTETFEKGANLFNFFRLDWSEVEKIVLVEGYMDVIAYDRIGITDCVAIMGTALTEKQIDLLKRCPKLKTIILSFDNDEAGMKATIDHGIKLLKHHLNVTVIGNYDKKYKDVDQLVNESPDTLKQAYHQRIDFLNFLIKESFKNSLTIDEKQNTINDLILIILNYGDALLQTQYLKQIAELSGFLIEDLKNKVNDLKKQSKRYLKKIKNNDIKQMHAMSFQEITSDLLDSDLKDDASIGSNSQVTSTIEDVVFEFKKTITNSTNKLNKLYDLVILYASYDIEFTKYLTDHFKFSWIIDPKDPRKIIWKNIQYLIEKQGLETISPKEIRQQLENTLNKDANYQAVIDYYDQFLANKVQETPQILKNFYKNKNKLIQDIFEKLLISNYKLAIAYLELQRFEEYKKNNHSFTNQMMRLNNQIIILKKELAEYKK